MLTAEPRMQRGSRGSMIYAAVCSQGSASSPNGLRTPPWFSNGPGAFGNREYHPQETVSEADPTNRVPRTPGGYQGTYHGEGQEEHEAHRCANGFTDGAEGGRVTCGLRGWGRKSNTRTATNMVAQSATSDQANHAAARVLIMPAPGSRPFVPYVTKPPYRAIVFQALRLALRDRDPLTLGPHLGSSWLAEDGQRQVGGDDPVRLVYYLGDLKVHDEAR
jgi:hypothetical protein